MNKPSETRSVFLAAAWDSMILGPNRGGSGNVKWGLPWIPEREGEPQGSQMRPKIHDGLSVIFDLEAQMDALAAGGDCDRRSVLARMDADTYSADAAASYRARVAMAGGLGGAVHVHHTVSLRP
jgi:hypothetical protein